MTKLMTMERPNGYASLSDMQIWARAVMKAREPDYIIGENYLRRWWVLPRNAFCNVYLHEFRRSDDDRALHDHPWANSSYILEGSYIEHLPGGISITRNPGDYVIREAEAQHRVELIDNQPVISLFSTSQKVRDWGFQCPQGWVPWQEFTSPEDSSKTGRGCGEH